MEAWSWVIASVGPAGYWLVTMAPSKPAKVYCLKVTLGETEPPIWRRVLVPADITLARLHRVLQDAMGWTNSHLHCFEVGDRRFGAVGVEEDHEDLRDERRVRLATVLPRKGATLVYRYDYGDDWEHVVVLEDVVEPDPRLAYPLCVGGARACPPEDCGGPLGYEELLRVLDTPDDEEHDSMLTWLGGYFEPESFDANMVNRLFRNGRTGGGPS